MFPSGLNATPLTYVLAAVEGGELAVVVGGVPEHHLGVDAGGGERVPVRAERDPEDGALAALEGGELAVVVGGVPEHDLAVVAGGGERVPVRAERDPVDA